MTFATDDSGVADIADQIEEKVETQPVPEADENYQPDPPLPLEANVADVVEQRREVPATEEEDYR